MNRLLANAPTWLIRPAVVVSVLLLTGCEPISPSGEPMPASTSTQTQTNSNTSSGGGGGSCSYTLNRDITSPTQLVNTGSGCDYLLSGWVEVRSRLTIDPGVVIRAEADARLVLDGGEISAVGTPSNRIVMEGLSPVQGYWRGIDIQGGRPTEFAYVDIKDAGQVCSISFCPDVGFMVDNVAFSFTHSSVSNSYVIGMSITEDVNLQAFSNNRFYNNASHGLAVHNEQVPLLDTASDYRGAASGAENERAGVSIHSGEQWRGRVFQWKNLNAPYVINGYFNVEGGILRLDPGVELHFDDGAWMNVEGNGVLQALGTASQPVQFLGRRSQPGYWDGIRFRDSPWIENVLEHTVLSHSGNTDGLVSAYAAINLDESRVRLNHVRFSDNSRWAIVCNENEFPYDPSVIVDEGSNTFFNNNSGTVDSDCVVQ